MEMAMEDGQIKHLGHYHPLMLIKPEETDVRWDLTCYGCEQPISVSSSSANYYGCKGCSFFLHKTCAEQPREMTHTSHPQHPLTLLADPRALSYRGDAECEICGKKCNRFIYHCSLCRYNIDMKCALVVLSIKGSINHTSHPHQLIPLQKESMFLCDACGEEHKGTSFLCTTCGFWINQKCASSPPKLRLYNHPHTLSLGYFFPGEEYETYDCQICSERIYRRNWFYSCSQCRHYKVHFRSAVNNGTEATELDSSKSVTASSDKDTVIYLPRRDDSVDIITQFIKNTSEQGKYKEATEIKHICHDHPLTYFDFEKPIDQAASRSMSDGSSLLSGERNAGKCDGCAQSISAPFYHCVECNFSLHVWCAELPHKLQHPGHPEHTLSLTMAKYYVECVNCHLFQNIMHYVCWECSFYLDCKCASLPRVVNHETHNHNLALRRTSISKCISCGVPSGISFECGGCQHYLCTRCVFFPWTVRHRYDKLHPFILNYSRLSYQTDDDFCEICEEEINSDHWFYHCGKCNQYLHKDCVFPLTSKKPYLLEYWFPRRFQQHQHRLVYVKLYEDLSCSLCKRIVPGDSTRALLCPLCKFCLCLHCWVPE